MTNIKKSNPFLKIRDISIVFRNKGKKLKAVNETTIDIFKGEIFGLVGESGSGKTTIARSIVGVQGLNDGAIYMDDVIVAGKAESLYKLNISITKKLQDFENKIYSITKNLKYLFEDLKKIYSNNDASKKIKKEDFINKLNINKIIYIDEMYKYSLEIINRMSKKQERIVRFVKNITKQIPEISLELENSILTKQYQINKLIFELKKNVEEIFLLTNGILNKSKVDLKKLYVFSDLIEPLFNSLDNVITKNLYLIDCIEICKKIQYENTLLVAPSKIKDKKLPLYYKMIYIKRTDFINECNNQLNILYSLGEEADKNYIEKLEYFKRDFWSKKNMNISVCKSILDSFSNNNYDYKKLDIYYKKLQNTDFENTLKELITSRKKLDDESIDSLKIELNYIKKIVKRNIVKDAELIEHYYKWKSIENNYTKSDYENIVEFIEFLELPSIDNLVRKSFFFKPMSKKDVRENRRNIQMIFQDPGSSLNDRMAIEEIVGEGLCNFKKLYKSEESKKEYMDYYNLHNSNKISDIKSIKPKDVKKYLILKTIKSVGLLPEHLSRYPHEFSGGQRQRIGIARSLIMKPKIIVADEPISALDVSIRAQVLNLFKKFQQEQDITFIFVAHDLSVVRFITDRIAVIYHGQILEMAEADELFKNPIHPYTKSLLSAIPQPEPSLARNIKSFVYEPDKEHYDYIFDLPSFKKLEEGHYVYINNREYNEYKAKIKNIK
ncbi:oligopeptide ABC transporter ATP-binding protein [Spiroplasma corruscae]|uniref:Oligopeptide ABC transporter ATP-binding protein n=1 Tax=Spiroplasma corruscae TaxID=216934 RepID=A0A222EPH9_9MOLU|nr:oligopeptide ABC transporter ATP-binding protein OppF [Spiroplasma corruscae]ASP28193.1 oligopeptide ABC transporter ATP-binding protein [Spiroplasma corruscae]